MKKKIVSGILFTLVLIGILGLAFDIQPVGADGIPIVFVEPLLSHAMTGESFSVRIMVSEVVNLYAWQINMSFDPNILECVNTTKGEFLAEQPEGTDMFKWIDQEYGWVLFEEHTCGAYPGVSGSGWLASVEFQVIGTGECVLNIDDPLTLLLEMNYPQLPIEIPHTRENSFFTTEVAELQKSYTQLLGLYDQLLANYSLLLDKYSSLNSYYHLLLAEHQDLQKKYNDLESNYSSLNSTYTSIQTNHNTLSSTYNALCSDYDSLNSTYHSLQTDYDELQSEYTALTGDFSTITNLNYLLIITTIVFIATTVYLALRKPKIKPEPKTL